jgi:thiamine pyrophosphokinase
MVTVVCTGGEAPPSSLSLLWIDAADRTIAADGGLKILKTLGRRADVWVGDGDSLGPLDVWSDWYREALVLDRAKDDSDTEAAVKLALDRGATEVWLVGGAGQRMDHWWANQRLLAHEGAVTRWLTGHEEIWNLGPGGSVHVVPGTVSVFPLGSGPWKVASHGLRWPLDAVDFHRWHSLSNEAQAGGADVSVAEGRILVLRPFEGAPTP